MTEFEKEMLKIQKERNEILTDMRNTIFDGFDAVKEAFYRTLGEENKLLEILDGMGADTSVIEQQLQNIDVDLDNLNTTLSNE